jgi:hypothetical protein
MLKETSCTQQTVPQEELVNKAKGAVEYNEM